MNNNKVSCFAAFTTLKTISEIDNNKNIYEILAEFISYIIHNEKLSKFIAVDIKNSLYETFEFEIPEASIKSALKKIKYITLSKGVYTVNTSQMKFNDSFSDNINIAEKELESIVFDLETFIKSNSEEKEISNEIIKKSLVAYLLDDYSKNTNGIFDIISEFILKNEHNSNLKKSLDSVREGSILYMGLNLNIVDIGSLTKDIVFYLDTEILFNLVGYNGLIYSQITEDFIAQVNLANKNKQRIKLRFFKDVFDEVNSYFESARLIVENKIPLLDKVAMKNIIKGCKTASDVDIKKADFFIELKSKYNIYEEKEICYYNTEYNKYNIESIDYDKYDEQEGWKFISHINKLRKGDIAYSDLDSKYLLITNTRSTLKISNDYVSEIKELYKLDRINNYAVSLNYITNLLWYKLGTGFGNNEYPSNVNTVFKARMILSSSISNRINEVYKEIKTDYNSGKISKEQLDSRILTLHNKHIEPETLSEETIYDDMDFSQEYISRHERKVSQMEKSLFEKEEEINKLINENKQSQATIQEKDKIIEDMNLKFIANEAKLKESEEYESKKRLKKLKVKRILVVIFKYIILAIALYGGYVFIKNYVDNDFLNRIILLATIIGYLFNFVRTIISEIEKIMKQ